MRSTKHRLRDGVASAVVFCAVVFALTIYDERVQEQFGRLSAGTDEWTTWGDRLTDLAGALVTAARYQSIDHAPLLTFVAVGAVLFVFMFRT